jgi:hypothetical protein
MQWIIILILFILFAPAIFIGLIQLCFWFIVLIHNPVTWVIVGLIIFIPYLVNINNAVFTELRLGSVPL